MQPTYIPWSGYFGLINTVDTFVFLDDVQFDKRSWQQRNKIKTQTGDQWLSVPVKTKGRMHQHIKEVELDKSSNFLSEHIKAIEFNYRKAKYFQEYFEEINSIFKKDFNFLVDLNINLISKITNFLNLKVTFVKSSEVGVNGKKDQKLFNLCKALSADLYVSPQGSRGYLERSHFFSDNQIEVKYIEFVHPVYPQLNGEFIQNLSVLDLLFNVGENSGKLIASSSSLESD